MSNHMKAIIAAVLPLLYLVQRYIETGTFDANEWALLILAFASVLVDAVNNVGPGVKGHLKALIALLAPIVAAVVTGFFLGNWGDFEWTLLILAVVQGFLAYYISDTPSSTAPKSDPTHA